MFKYYFQKNYRMNISTACKTILFLFIILLTSPEGKAQVIYDGSKGIHTIGNKIDYYIDSSGSKTLKDIQQQQKFLRSAADVPDFGMIKKPVWLKINILNSSRREELMLEFDQSLLQEIQFYWQKEGKWNLSQSGELYPFHARTYNYHKFIYNLKIKPGSAATYYVRIRSTHEMQMPIFLSDRANMDDSNLTKNICFGIFFGIILVMFFYNLFIYFSVKDPIYLYYVIYIFIVGLAQATIEGYSFHYLWPDNTFLATRSFFLLTAFVNISGVEFTRKFLQTSKFIPKLDRVAYVLYAIYAVVIALTIRGNLYISYQILQFFAGIVSLYMLTIAVTIARTGYRPAKFFLIAWMPLIMGIIIWILKDYNVFSYNVFTNYSITIGSAMEVILLSFALADKINIFKAEKERSQEETLMVLQENERIIREQNVVLELKVNERTLELSDSNRELGITLEDLKQAQSQLVESEKMASLGQLTAGIAHEINNPINFVTANIKPLKRDVDMMFEAFSFIENISLSEATVEEKQSQIAEYKEDLDFDYLIVEINDLLKGIKEGASRTAEIVKGLKIFSRLDEDDLKVADMNEGLDSTLVIANNLLNNNITVVREYGAIPAVECYAGKLNQVFLNIISNAAYAVHKQFGDKPGGKIVISTTNDDEYVYISIKDNGTGMDEKTQKKIFEPFFTTKDVGEGTGLGMSIAYNTIKKHNGQIQLISSAGEGTQFILQLPVIHKVIVI
jgi:signal transduction histidine kinase